MGEILINADTAVTPGLNLYGIAKSAQTLLFSGLDHDQIADVLQHGVDDDDEVIVVWEGADLLVIIDGEENV